MDLRKSPSSFSKIVTHLLLLYPILNTYAWPGSIGVGREVLMALVVIFIIRLLKKGQRPTKLAPKEFNVYCYYWLASAILSVIYIGISVIGALPGILYSFLFMLLFFNEIDFEYLIRWYKLYAIVFVPFFFIQEIMYFSTGIRISGLIPGIPLTVDSEGGSVSYMEQVIYGTRSSSVFSEPAHFAQWLLPLLAIELMYDKNKKTYYYAAGIVVALLLLRSGNAMLGLFVVLFSFFLFLSFEKKSKFRFTLIVAFATVFVMGSTYFFNSSAGADVLSRQDELKISGSSVDRMGQVRLYRGYYVFENFDLWDQIVGVSDIPTLMTYIKTSKVSALFMDNETYFNAIQSILIKTGYVGILLFFILCINISKGNVYAGKAIIWSFVALSFVAGLFFTPSMAIYMVLAYRMKLSKTKQSYV